MRDLIVRHTPLFFYLTKSSTAMTHFKILMPSITAAMQDAASNESAVSMMDMPTPGRRPPDAKACFITLEYAASLSICSASLFPIIDSLKLLR